MKYRMITLVVLATLSACDKTSWNNPHKAKEADANIVYSSFSESPKTLDPVKSYSSDEIRFNAQIYEPLLQYDYFARPYQLEPLIATQMPQVTYQDKEYNDLPANAATKDIVYSVYEITIKPGVNFQPHPAFARGADGRLLYQNLTQKDLKKIHHLRDFKQTGTRELTVDDYIYEIKRLAIPQLNSPIYGLMSGYIDGLDDLHKHLVEANKANIPFLDVRKFELDGVKKIDDYHFQIRIKGKYPQFLYWLAMSFFAPIPWEVDQFYFQPGMKERHMVLGWQPVGTGPYMLVENNPNKEMVMVKNPNFRGVQFPSDGSAQDKQDGYMLEENKNIPLVDEFNYSLEKETIPRWTKFLQGYYDNSAISSDSFDQAIQVDADGNPDLTPELKNKGIYLQTVISPTIFYMGFNMLDPVVGGDTEQARKLRQAISIAVDYKEYISIFLNGRGIPAQGPIPPGIFGFDDAPNPVINQSLAHAKELLIEAGYPGGINAQTGKPLVLNYDVTASSGPDDKARFDWMRKQFSKLGIQLNVRATHYNRFQEKMRTGSAQIFSWGWHADYPDAENFLFLLYGPNGKIKKGGENAANYSNPQFDQLFTQMKSMDNNDERKALIAKMIHIVQNDAPWVWGVNPKDFVLSHQWVRPTKPNGIANNLAKYMSVDPNLRAKLRAKWNKPVRWPLYLLVLLVVVIVVPVVMSYSRRQRRAIKSK